MRLIAQCAYAFSSLEKRDRLCLPLCRRSASLYRRISVILVRWLKKVVSGCGVDGVDAVAVTTLKAIRGEAVLDLEMTVRFL